MRVDLNFQSTLREMKQSLQMTRRSLTGGLKIKALDCTNTWKAEQTTVSEEHSKVNLGCLTRVCFSQTGWMRQRRWWARSCRLQTKKTQTHGHVLMMSWLMCQNDERGFFEWLYHRIKQVIQIQAKKFDKIQAKWGSIYHPYWGAFLTARKLISIQIHAGSP